MAIIDARTLSSGTKIKADLCIVGAGAAGLVIANKFIGRRERVVVLESGGEHLEADTQNLYAGEIAGQIHAPLDQGRLRYYGGTTNHWTAHVRPLDPIDLEARTWVPHSGWPFGREVLDPYYERARVLLGLPERPFDVDTWKSEEHPPFSFASDRLLTTVRQEVLEEHRRFGPRMRQEITQSENVVLQLYSNVLRIELGELRNHVARLEVGTLSGVRFDVEAGHFVLATGGIENARILLLSSIAGETGSRPGVVGAFFANHPAGWAGYIQPSDPNATASFYRPQPHAAGTTRASVALHPETQRKEELLNCWLQLLPQVNRRFVRDRVKSESTLANPPNVKFLLRDVDVGRLAADLDHDQALPRERKPTPIGIGVKAFAEPSTNPESRVRLSDERDALGQRRVILDWRLAEFRPTPRRRAG